MSSLPSIIVRCILLSTLSLAAVACDDDDDGGGKEPATPIAEARRSAKGTEVTIEGHVSVPPGAFVSAMGDEGFAIQDDTGGVYIKVDEKVAFGVGTKVRVTGLLDEQNQLGIVKAVPADIEMLAGTRQVAPAEVETGAVNETVEGTLIQVTGGITDTFMDDSPYGYKLYIDDSSGEIQIFVHVSANLDRAMLESLIPGQALTVTGFAAQYEATYEVAPRDMSDLVIE